MNKAKRARRERRHQERATQRQLGRQGSTARLEAARMAIQEPRFRAELDAAMWAATAPWASSIETVAQIRDLALRILRDSFWLDVSDVDFKVAFEDRKLRLRPVPAMGAVESAIGTVKRKLESARPARMIR